MSLTARDVAKRSVPRASSWTWFKSSLLYLSSSPESAASSLCEFDASTRRTRVVVSADACVLDEATLTMEERLRRERARVMSTGVTSFVVRPSPTDASRYRVLVPLPHALCIVEQGSGVLVPVVLREESPLLDPSLSPDGRKVCFVRDGHLCCVNVDDRSVVNLTEAVHTAPSCTHGLADFLAQEEMDRYSGYWWSPCSSKIMFQTVNEEEIPNFDIAHHTNAAPTASETHHYPFAGATNPRWALGIVDLESLEVGYLPLQITTAKRRGAKRSKRVFAAREPLFYGGDEMDISYLNRVHFTTSTTAYVQIQNRKQDHTELLRVDLASERVSCALAESSTSFINLHNNFAHLRDDLFLWTHEDSPHGYSTLVLKEQGKADVVLSSAQELVVSVDGVCEDSVVFTTIHESDFSSTVVKRACLSSRVVTTIAVLLPGTHEVVAGDNHAIVSHSSLHVPPSSVVYDTTGEWTAVSAVLESPPASPTQPIPVITKIRTTDDTDELYTAWYSPDPTEFGPGPHPTLVLCYGGPHVQLVKNAWATTVDKRANFYAQRGIAVLKTDNRGSSRRGRIFEATIHKSLGSLEVSDQVAGVRHYQSTGACGERVGILGWSYGGYLAASSLFDAPEVFHFAVAGAPVTHWDGYDTHYTERYMGLPSENAQGYERSSVMHKVREWRDRRSSSAAECSTPRLMLIHGMLDENVHFRHTARLLDVLTETSVPYELLAFPNERHSPRGEKERAFLEERMRAFVEVRLLGE